MKLDSRDNLHGKATSKATANAGVEKKMDMTSDRMFLGALVKAYSRPVTETKISANDIRIGLEAGHRIFNTSKNERSKPCLRSGLNPGEEGRYRVTRRQIITARICLVNVVLHD